jgi:trehalose-phosphatase
MSDVLSLIQSTKQLERPLLVGLDVDGTLAPIVQDPGLAAIPPSTQATLHALAKTPGIILALVTGRDLGSLRRMERLDGIWRAVEHGGVVLAPGEEPGDQKLTAAQQEALSRFRSWVERSARDAFVEYKPQAVAVHVRAIAERDPARAERLMQEAEAQAVELGLHVRRGKALREAEVAVQDKGRALAEIMDRSGARSVLYVGDDVTDFPAIDLAARRGLGVFVSSGEQPATPSRSAIILDRIDDVGLLLRGLVGSAD